VKRERFLPFTGHFQVKSESENEKEGKIYHYLINMLTKYQFV